MLNTFKGLIKEIKTKTKNCIEKRLFIKLKYKNHLIFIFN